MEAVWEKVKSVIKNRIPAHSFEMWIEPLDLEKCENGRWVIACPNFFSKKRVSDLYGNLISAELSTAIGNSCKLDFVVGAKRKPGLAKEQMPDQGVLLLKNRRWR